MYICFNNRLKFGRDASVPKQVFNTSAGTVIMREAGNAKYEVGRDTYSQDRRDYYDTHTCMNWIGQQFLSYFSLYSMLYLIWLELTDLGQICVLFDNFLPFRRQISLYLCSY